MKKVVIKFLVFWCGTKCNLKCKDCCNLIPYIKQISFDADQIVEDLIFVSKRAKILSLQLQGGEIFTHPQAAYIIQRVALMDIPKISITTNATIKLKDDVIEALKRNPHVGLTLSNYECTREKRLEFIKYLKECGITNFREYDFCFGSGEWFSSGGIYENKKSEEEAKKNFIECEEKYCLTLADGRLYTCGKILAINQLHNVSHNRYSIFDIRKWRIKNQAEKLQFKERNTDEEFLQFVDFINNSRTIYKEECKYCNIDKNIRIKPAIQLSKEEILEIKKWQKILE